MGAKAHPANALHFANHKLLFVFEIVLWVIYSHERTATDAIKCSKLRSATIELIQCFAMNVI